jgi:hypothetical protein
MMEVLLVRRSGGGPWWAGQIGSADEKGFAPCGDDDAIGGAARAAAAEFESDFAVDFCGDEDAAAGFGRKIREAREAAGVVGFGEGEGAERGLVGVFVVDEEGCGWKIDPGGGEIAALVPGIFTGVAGDVGELEGDPEIDRVPGGGGMGGAKNARHHEPDCACDAMAVAEEGAFVGESGGAGVISQGAGESDGGSRVGKFQIEVESREWWERSLASRAEAMDSI